MPGTSSSSGYIYDPEPRVKEVSRLVVSFTGFRIPTILRAVADFVEQDARGPEPAVILLTYNNETEENVATVVYDRDW